MNFKSGDFLNIAFEKNERSLLNRGSKDPVHKLPLSVEFAVKTNDPLIPPYIKGISLICRNVVRSQREKRAGRPGRTKGLFFILIHLGEDRRGLELHSTRRQPHKIVV